MEEEGCPVEPEAVHMLLGLLTAELFVLLQLSALLAGLVAVLLQLFVLHLQLFMQLFVLLFVPVQRHVLHHGWDQPLHC